MPRAGSVKERLWQNTLSRPVEPVSVLKVVSAYPKSGNWLSTVEVGFDLNDRENILTKYRVVYQRNNGPVLQPQQNVDSTHLVDEMLHVLVVNR